MLVSDVSDYHTENIVHPSKNMSTYGTKIAFLLKDNNNKTCHRIYWHEHQWQVCCWHVNRMCAMINESILEYSYMCIFVCFLRGEGGAVWNGCLFISNHIYPPGPCSSMPLLARVRYSLLMLKNNTNAPKLCQILPSLLVWPEYKTHSILTSISEYKRCVLYASIYGTQLHFENWSIQTPHFICLLSKLKGNDI